MPIWSSFTHITEKMDPKMMMNAGLKNCVMDAGMVQPKISRLTLRSAKRVRDVPACSKQAQNTMLMTMKMTKAIMRSRHMGPSLMPARTSEAATSTKRPVRR